MAERTVTQLPFGEGLDRASGKTVVRPSAMRDVSNMILEEGRATIRRGLLSVESFVDDVGDPVTHIIGGRAQRVAAIGIVVGYQQTTGKVFVYRTDSFGENPVIISRDTAEEFWFELDPLSEPPLVWLTDTYGKVFLAHDDAIMANRAPTYYYDSLLDQLLPLEMDFGTGLEQIYFRGVRTHLSYLLGWGFGTTMDPDHPEMVRASMPNDPTVFDKMHFWYAGQRADPILNIESNGDIALVLKQTDRYQIFGYDRATFGIKPIDSHSGLAGSHLSVGVDGQIFAWSVEGPNVTDGRGPAQSIAAELDLDGFEPESLIAGGPATRGFAFYVHDRRLIVFVFGQRGYALSIKNPQKWRWSYLEFGRELTCAFHLYHTAPA